MQLDQLRDLVAASTAAQWAKLPVGPLYREGYTVYGMGSDASTTVRWHYDSAVYRDDVDLTLQWGMDEHSDETDEDRSFDWAQRFIDSRVRSFFVDVFWRGSLVDRYVLAHVNGGHGLIPMPYGSIDGHYPTVNTRQVKVAKLVSSLEGGHVDPIDGVMELAGFAVERDWG